MAWKEWLTWLTVIITSKYTTFCQSQGWNLTYKRDSVMSKRPIQCTMSVEILSTAVQVMQTVHISVWGALSATATFYSARRWRLSILVIEHWAWSCSWCTGSQPPGGRLPLFFASLRFARDLGRYINLYCAILYLLWLSVWMRWFLSSKCHCSTEPLGPAEATAICSAFA